MVPTYSEEAREAFGWFGAAAHNAQFFEADLISLHLVVAALQGEALTLPDLKNMEAKKSKKTLGQLLHGLGEWVPLPQEDIDLWNQALAERNKLMHSFFWKNVDRLKTEYGCLQVAAELRETALLFDAASSAARRTIKACIDLLGVDPAAWDRVVQDELTKLSNFDDA